MNGIWRWSLTFDWPNSSDSLIQCAPDHQISHNELLYTFFCGHIAFLHILFHSLRIVRSDWISFLCLFIIRWGSNESHFNCIVVEWNQFVCLPLSSWNECEIMDIWTMALKFSWFISFVFVVIVVFNWIPDLLAVNAMNINQLKIVDLRERYNWTNEGFIENKSSFKKSQPNK